ncbi:ATP-binding protein [Patescibacteria group bacterium]
MKKINKIITCIIVTTSVISMFLIWFLSEGAQGQIEETIENQFSDAETQLAMEISRSLQEEIDCVVDHLTIMSQVSEVRYGSTEECGRKLKEMHISVSDKLGNLGRLNSDGIFYCGVVDSIVGVDATKYSYIQKILNDADHDSVMSRAIMFQYKDHERYLTAVHVPVYDDDNKFIGTLGGAIYFDEIYETYLKDIAENKGGFIYLVDDNGDILYHPDSDFVGRNQNDQYMRDVFSESSGWQDLAVNSQSGLAGVKKYTYKGEQHLATYVPAHIFSDRHWSVVTSIPTSKIKGFVAPLVLSLEYQVILIVIVLTFFTAGIIFYCQRENRFLKKRHEFIDMISHQLRTPVTSIKWNLEVMEKDIKVEKHINQIYEKIINLGVMIENLLFFIEKEKKYKRLGSERIDLVEVIQKTLIQLKGKIESKNITVSFEQSQSKYLILIEKKIINKVIYYLLDNATVYSREDRGSINITIFETDENIRVSIQDNGIGIPQKEQMEVFNKFFRASNASLGKNEGSGVSLYLVKLLIEAQGGVVGFESIEDKGSIFWFEIPRIK